MQSIRVYSFCFDMKKEGDIIFQRIRVALSITATLLLVGGLFIYFWYALKVENINK